MLPNGKVNYKALKAMADKEASQAQETVMDSLGQMKSMSRAAILENAVIHRCYAFWMLGVLTDHYAWCAMSTDPKARSGTTPHLMTLSLHRSHACAHPCARSHHGRTPLGCGPCHSAQPWPPGTSPRGRRLSCAPLATTRHGREGALVHAAGVRECRPQDLFGFIMLGAYQDSRPQGSEARKRARLGWPDLFVFAVYLFMAMPLPQIFRGITGGWAYPDRTSMVLSVC